MIFVIVCIYRVFIVCQVLTPKSFIVPHLILMNTKSLQRTVLLSFRDEGISTEMFGDLPGDTQAWNRWKRLLPLVGVRVGVRDWEGPGQHR